MTGYDIYASAVSLLNIAEENNDYKESLPGIALQAVNEIGNDLFEDFYLSDIFEEVSCKKRFLSAFINGVAMVLSAAFNMYNQNAYFTTIYNQKRAAAKGRKDIVKNNFPYVSEGTI